VTLNTVDDIEKFGLDIIHGSCLLNFLFPGISFFVTGRMGFRARSGFNPPSSCCASSGSI
jgi:hypothetical protein